MNNLKERNSVLNGLQESSDDPPGFIYPHISGRTDRNPQR